MLAAILHQESRWTKTRNTLKETCESWWQLKTNTGRAKEQQDTNDCSYRERITEISEDGIIVLYEETVIECVCLRRVVVSFKKTAVSGKTSSIVKESRLVQLT